MLIATRKHHYLVDRLSRLAQVSVGQPEPQEADASLPEPEVLLNGFSSPDPTIIQAAEQGIQQAESDLRWRGVRHRVLKVEGLLVDGIDPVAARIAAEEATRALIQS